MGVVKKLNKHEFFKAKNVIREEMQGKKYIPEIIYYKRGSNDYFTIYTVTKTPTSNIKNPSVLDKIKNGTIKCDNDIYIYHDAIAYAKRENLAKQKAEDLQRVINMYREAI